MSREIGDRAVVLGASMAGLLAARVLADAYAQVARGRPGRAARDTGAPSRRPPRPPHPCAGGTRTTGPGGAVPGLTDELVADGAPVGDMLTDARFYLGGHRLHQAHTGLMLLCASRPFLEGHVRARVRALPNVRFLDGYDVAGLATTPDGGRVTGARVVRRAVGSAEELLAADLVVDASGRGLTHTGLAGRPRLSPAGAGRGADRAGLCDPDLPAGTRGPRRARWPSSTLRPPTYRGPAPSRDSKAIGGC